MMIFPFNLSGVMPFVDPMEKARRTNEANAEENGKDKNK